jgi:hypothetical protein
MTANVDGRCDFERGIVCRTKVDKHLQRDPNFLPQQEGRFCHSDVLRAGRSNGAIVPSAIKSAMVLAGDRQPVNATSEFLLRWNGKVKTRTLYEPKAKGTATQVAFTDDSVGRPPRNVVCRSKPGVAFAVLVGFCTAHPVLTHWANFCRASGTAERRMARRRSACGVWRPGIRLGREWSPGSRSNRWCGWHGAVFR